MNSYVAQFARIEQDYFRERLNDLRDVILRVGSHLTRKRSPRPTEPSRCTMAMSR